MNNKLGISLCLFSTLLVGCGSINNNETNDMIEKNKIYLDELIQENGLSETSNLTYEDLYVSNKGSATLENTIELPLFESSSWELNFNNLTLESGHLLTYGQNELHRKIYLTFNKENKIFLIGVVNNKKDQKFLNYGFELDVDELKNVDCKLTFKDDEFKFFINSNEYTLNKFNVNQKNQVTKEESSNLSIELKNQIISITGSEYLILDAIGSLTSSAHLFNGSFNSISSTLSYKKGINFDPYDNNLDNINVFGLGSSIFYGHTTSGYSFLDMLRDNFIYTKVTKETVSGTTLAKQTNRKDSYLERLENKINNSNNYQYIVNDDVLVIQLSTNDFINNLKIGKVLEENIKDKESFDTFTITGAIEYIIALSKELNPNIKIMFISCPILPSYKAYETYKNYNNKVMLDIKNKWNIYFLDLFNFKPAINKYLTIDKSSTKGYFSDDIHPNTLGYSALIYPNFIKYLKEIL